MPTDEVHSDAGMSPEEEEELAKVRREEEEAKRRFDEAAVRNAKALAEAKKLLDEDED